METINKRITLIDRIVNFMNGQEGGVATLKAIYNSVKNEITEDGEKVPNFLEDKVRCVIYRDTKNDIKRLAKGVYMIAGENTAGLIIHGDGRKLEEIEDDSIDIIVTDHPWSDKKAHKSGNQKNFAADYEDACFRYEQEDFNQKARVLKEGSYLVEFIPSESFSNFEYLYEIKAMAKKAGFQYYAKLMWIKQPEGAINTGRTTKGTEDILIFTKGKARRLSGDKKPYMTKNMLAGRLDIPAPMPKEKRHQAEKPTDLYSYLISMMSNEEEVCLDQFGGSCNIIEAAIKTNRFAIAYEWIKEFVNKAVNRLKGFTLYGPEEDLVNIAKSNDIEEVYLEDLLGHQPEVNVVVADTCIQEEDLTETIQEEKVDKLEAKEIKEEEMKIEIKEIDIPKDVSVFQKDLLLKLSNVKKALFSEEDITKISSSNLEENKGRECINDIFQYIYEDIYEKHYRRLNVQLDMIELCSYNQIEEELKLVFEERVQNVYLRKFYKNYLIEAEDFIKYRVKKYGITTLSQAKDNLHAYLEEYLNKVSSHNSFKGKDLTKVKTMIYKLLI